MRTKVAAIVVLLALLDTAAFSAPDVLRILDTAPIKGSPEHMGGGTMVKFKIYLGDGSAKGFKCLFKPRQGGEQTFRHEIAAYRIDRLCHMGHVPIVARRVFPYSLFAGRSGAGRMLVSGGKIEGSLQQWIQNSSDPYGLGAESWSREWLHRLSTFSADIPDHDAARQISDMFLLDYLQGNMDRFSGGNILRDNHGDFWFIDNAEAFGGSARPLHDFDRVLRFDRKVVEALRHATEADFAREVGPYLSDSELRSLLARRLHALAHMRSVVNTYGEAKAYL